MSARRVHGRRSRSPATQRTKAYVARRTTEGKTKKEIIRCLKRYIAREMYELYVGPNDQAGGGSKPKTKRRISILGTLSWPASTSR